MCWLVVEFGADKVTLSKMEEHVVLAIQKRGVKFEPSSIEVEELPHVRQNTPVGDRLTKIPMMRYRWRIPLHAEIEQSTIESLRKDLSNIEVHSLRVESFRLP